MINIKEKQMQLSDQDRKIGLIGDNLTDYREFSMPRVFKGLDLSGYSAWVCIEPVKGDPYNQLLTKTLSGNHIILKWSITNQNVQDAGSIGVVIKLASTETGNPVWQTYKETFVVYNHVDANAEASIIPVNVFEQAVASAAASAAAAANSKTAAAASASQASDYELDAFNHMLEIASLSDKAVESAVITSQKAAIVESAADAETARKNAEVERVSAENIRSTAENNRITAEGLRVNAEQDRVAAENGRVTAESGRTSAESGRVAAEQSRVTAESTRQTGYAGFNGRITAVETGKADKAQETWITPTLINGWTAFATVDTPAFYKDQFGKVHLKGAIKSGTVPSTAYILPAGYRPARTMYIAATANGAFAVVGIYAAGNVQAYIGSNAMFSFDGISFRAEG